MGPEEAEWVRDNALPKAIRRNLIPACPCQYGVSGYCDMGTKAGHARCPGHTVYSPETYIVTKESSVTGFPGGPHAQVWLADRVCRWRCPCDCHTQVPSEPGQPALFDLAAHPAATHPHHPQEHPK